MTRELPDHYAVLGVATTASPAQIAYAYRGLVRSLHPDIHPDTGPEELSEVVDAYAVLRDPARRADYDQQRRSAPNPSAPNPSAPNPSARTSVPRPPRRSRRPWPPPAVRDRCCAWAPSATTARPTEDTSDNDPARTTAAQPCPRAVLARPPRPGGASRRPG